MQEKATAEEPAAAEDQPAEHAAEDAKDEGSEGEQEEPEEEEEPKPEIKVTACQFLKAVRRKCVWHVQHKASPGQHRCFIADYDQFSQAQLKLTFVHRSGHPHMMLASPAQTRRGIATPATMSTTGKQ